MNLLTDVRTLTAPAANRDPGASRAGGHAEVPSPGPATGEGQQGQKARERFLDALLKTLAAWGT